MRFLRPTFAVLLAASVASIGSVASAGTYQQVRANPQALPVLQQDLLTAINSMKEALPIYDGNRVRSIRAAHRALVIVDHAIYGTKAPKRTEPNVNDKVGSAGAKAKYTPDQISASQGNMKQGLLALQTAWRDMQTAAGSNPNKQGVNAAKNLQTAITEATTAISLHTPKS